MEKLAYITGTTRGLGHALVNVYRADGWRVIELSRPEIDLAQPDLVRIRALLRQPAVDAVFINNAATLAIAPHFSAAEISREIVVNLVSPLQLIFAFIEHHQRGTVVNITSGAASQGLPWWALYCAAKAGVEGCLRALELQGVRCLNFNPGVIDTDMQDSIRNSQCPDRDRFMGFKFAGLLQDPAVVAMAVLAAHKSSMLT